MKIIPAIDIINGQCVRLSEGDYTTKKVYFENPVEAAKSFEEAGLKYLHLVDLDGAKAGEVQNWDILESICQATDLQVDFSGGIKTKQQVEQAFELGAQQVAIGSLCIKDPDTVKGWLNEFGSNRIIVGADVKDEKIAIHGWQETSSISIFDFLSDFTKAGAKHFLCTDVSKDGMLQGASTKLYKLILKQFPDVKLIASGGVSSILDLEELKSIKCAAAIVGKAIYENRVSLNELVAL